MVNHNGKKVSSEKTIKESKTSGTSLGIGFKIKPVQEKGRKQHEEHGERVS